VKVSKASAVAVALASFFVSAQDSARVRDLDLRIQVGLEKSQPRLSKFIPRPADTPPGDPHLMVQPEEQIAPLIRMIGEMPGTMGFYYEIGGRFEGFSRLDYNRAYFDRRIDARDVKVSYSYFEVGVAYIFAARWGLSLGAHLEGRLERIKTSGLIYQNEVPGRLDGAASYLRPWGRVSMDFTFNNSGRFRPFIGAEMALPLMERQQKNAYWAVDQPQESRLLESIAPDQSAACYIGFRL